MLTVALIFIGVGLPLAVVGHRANLPFVNRMGGGLTAIGLLAFALWFAWWVYDAYFRYG